MTDLIKLQEFNKAMQAKKDIANNMFGGGCKSYVEFIFDSPVSIKIEYSDNCTWGEEKVLDNVLQINVSEIANSTITEVCYLTNEGNGSISTTNKNIKSIKVFNSKKEETNE